MKSIYFLAGIMGLLLAGSCTSSKKLDDSAGGVASLKNLYKNDFLVGAALNTSQIQEREPHAKELVPRQFSAITPENVMKCENIHPQWDQYNFTVPDEYVSYGEKNHMYIMAHTLIWHSQLSPFVRRIQDPDSLRLFMKNHISTIVGRYAGRVNGWDVVNEALEEDGSLRKSIFLQKLGDEYIVDAFRLAQLADPKAELYYNDYNIEQPKKRAGAIALIRKIQAAGVRIDGVGIQGHWRAAHVPLEEIEKSIQEFSALGLKVAFTELDLGVLPNPWDSDAADVNQKAEYSAKMNPYPNGLPDSVATMQAQSYANLFALFLKYRNHISRVTFWGVNDGNSWLNNWPIRGRTNYPLVFDRAYLPKAAFYRITELKTNPERKKKAF